MSATEQNLETVKQWYAARKAGDQELAASFLSENSRMWFDEKTGPGKIRDRSGKGPWSAWDEYFESESRFENWQADSDSVWLTVYETNKFYRLLERTPGPYRATYYIDSTGKIAGTLISSIPGGASDRGRTEEFKTWLQANYPGELEQLQPNGKIDPKLEKAQLWHHRINEWRESVGLERIE